VTALEALSFYAKQRTFNQKGVTIASQKRYVLYFEALVLRAKMEGLAATMARVSSAVTIRCLRLVLIGINNNSTPATAPASDPPTDKGVYYNDEHMSNVCDGDDADEDDEDVDDEEKEAMRRGSDVLASLNTKDNASFQSLMARIAMRGDAGAMRACGGGAVDSIVGDRIEFAIDVVVSGDVKVSVASTKGKQDELFHFWLHTSMLTFSPDGRAVVRLGKLALDGAIVKDEKLVKPSFRVEFHVAQLQ